MLCTYRRWLRDLHRPSATGPLHVPTLPHYPDDDSGVVSVTPLVLTDNFPGGKPNTNRGQPNVGEVNERKTSPSGILNYIKNRLSCADEEETITDDYFRNNSPHDEVTLFEVPMSSTSNLRNTSLGTNNTVDDVPLPAQSDESDQGYPEDMNHFHSRHPPNDSPAEDTSIYPDTVYTDETPATFESNDGEDLEKSSLDLLECLSNQRMMVQGRTLSMTSSDDVIGDPGIRKEEENGDGGNGKKPIYSPSSPNSLSSKDNDSTIIRPKWEFGVDVWKFTV